MKRNDIFSLISLLLMPCLLILLGLILIFSPDSAAAFIGKAIAWILILVGAIKGLGWLGSSPRQTGKLIGTAVLLLAGLWLLANPLVLAKWLGRILGLIILVQGVLDLAEDRRAGLRPIVTLVTGGILLLLPLAISRTIFIILGIVVLCVGVSELLGRLRREKLEKSDDPDIIDVDKL